MPSYFRSLEHLLWYCARPPSALERLSVTRGPDGRIARVRYLLPRHKAANWVGRGRSRKSTRPGASGVVELMARVGEEFPLECPNCGGDILLNAFITEPGPIRKILTHLGEPLEPPSGARPPTGASWCRSMTIATSLKRRIDELPVIDIHSL